MTAVPNFPPAPVGQQGPPAGAAAYGGRGRRGAPGSHRLSTGAGARPA